MEGDDTIYLVIMDKALKKLITTYDNSGLTVNKEKTKIYVHRGNSKNIYH